MNKPNKRKNLFANKLHKELFLVISISCIVPALIAIICAYYLIFYITADQIAIPEAIAYNLIPASKKVINILLVAIPLSITILLWIFYKLSHRIVGPFDRIKRELEESLEGTKKTPITIRNNDKFKPIVDLINKLLDKIK